MIAMTTKTGSLFAVSGSIAKDFSVRRRRITPEIGRALEKLGHAIEYLTDEMRYEGNGNPFSKHQMEAVRLLMALRSQVFQDAPEVRPLAVRCRAILRQFIAPAS